jgi:predicted nucleotide-binding protein
MDKISIIFAKLAGLQKIISTRISGGGRYFDPPTVLSYFEQFHSLKKDLIEELPQLYADLPDREMPKSSGTSDNNGRGYIVQSELSALQSDLSYIFEVRSNSQIGEVVEEKPRRIFISHGTSTEWYKVQAYIERDIQIPTLELAQEANFGRTILQKLSEESNKCSYAVIIMTGDDESSDGKPKARENVMHEIGFFQGKFGLQNVCLLYEEGTTIPSNIHGLVYIPFPKNYAEATYGALTREIKSVIQ